MTSTEESISRKLFIIKLVYNSSSTQKGLKKIFLKQNEILKENRAKEHTTGVYTVSSQYRTGSCVNY